MPARPCVAEYLHRLPGTGHVPQDTDAWDDARDRRHGMPGSCSRAD